MFYEACVEGGTDKRLAQLMFAAVWLKGPRWNYKKWSLTNVPVSVLKEEYEKCRRWLESEERTNEELIEWMDMRESQVQKGISPPLSRN